MYGGDKYGQIEYAGLKGTPSPNAIVDMTSLGANGILVLQFNQPDPNVNGVNVVLDDIPGTLLVLYLNKDYTEGHWFADAGELWKRVPQHSGINFMP